MDFDSDAVAEKCDDRIGSLVVIPLLFCWNEFETWVSFVVA